MGCLKSIITKILFIILVVAFFWFGGVNFISKTINQFQNPPREKMLEGAKNFGNFEKTGSDYKIGRTFKVTDYKKMTIEHKPSGQKITFIELPHGKTISEEDLNTKVVENKLQNLIKSHNSKVFEVQNLKIIKMGKMPLKSTKISYIDFTFELTKPVKQEMEGVLGVYAISDTDKKDEKPQLTMVLSARNKNKFSKKIVTDLLQTVDFK